MDDPAEPETASPALPGGATGNPAGNGSPTSRSAGDPTASSATASGWAGSPEAGSAASAGRNGTRKIRAAILISGRGSNMRALIEAARAPDYPIRFVVVISNRPEAAGLVYAREAGIETLVIGHKQYPSRAAFDAALHNALTARGVDLVACAGFMRLFTPEFTGLWQGRLVNIHPSLLPAFKGLHPQRQALEAGVTVAGCTVHYVTADVDSGPVIAQAEVPVLPGDTEETLSSRILETEHGLYSRALSTVARKLQDGESEHG